jgi:hypothetical protein
MTLRQAGVGALSKSITSVVKRRKGINHFVTARTFAGNQVYTQFSRRKFAAAIQDR